jgi:phosphoribosylanthranilate isomerase
MTTRVKICGVTRLDDALLAVELGASAIGFVFWSGSARAIEPQRARDIAARLPATVVSVGVFVDQSIEIVRRIADAARLGAVQLHGTEAVEDFDALPWPIIKAVSIQDAVRPPELSDLPRHVTALLDAHDPVRRGGTGRTIDWRIAASVAAERPIILSGGLRPENVADAVATVRPYAVDVASGVESAPGVKDAARLRAFFATVAEGSTR